MGTSLYKNPYTPVVLRNQEPSMSWGAALFVCVVILTASGTAKKKEVSGLYPFPRVGRSDGFSLHNICRDVLKRQNGLIPFPRVGRDFGFNRGEKDSGGGLWFGPRLGRSPDAWQFPSNLNKGTDDDSIERLVSFLKPKSDIDDKSMEESKDNDMNT